MKPIAISVQGLGKACRIGAAPRQSDTVLGALGSRLLTPLRNFRRLRALATAAAEPEDGGLVWAVKNLSFDVPAGQTLGIIGPNGAGKSTLLKILSRITLPTRGQAQIRGRVASLLEVGTGFHPELSGRENIFLNGAVLGMRRAEIARRFDEIIAFSGVERFLDTPVKLYSSGMKVRLAFSVAAHLEPEILVVDEVLAVGDAEFRAKCLGKMHGIAAQGRTVLFVSHSMGAIQSLCARALSMGNGELVDDGKPRAVIGRYLAQLRKARGDRFSLENPDRVNTGDLQITALAVVDGAGQATDKVIAGEPMTFQIGHTSRQNLPGVSFRLTVVNESGLAVGSMSTRLAGFQVNAAQEPGALCCTLPKNPFMLGEYHVDVAVRHHGKIIDSIPAALSFTVTDSVFFPTGQTLRNEHAVVYIDHGWSAEIPAGEWQRQGMGRGREEG